MKITRIFSPQYQNQILLDKKRNDKHNYAANINFEAIKINQINPKYLSKKDIFISELEKFTEGENNAKLIGQGLSSAVYSFHKLKNIVVKKSLNPFLGFNDEICHLKLLPDGIKNIQKFVAQAFDDTMGIFYLLSTKMEGHCAEYNTNPWSEKHLRSLFSTMFELDKRGIYHGDLHNGNMLLDSKGNTNFIDFEWTHIIDKNNFFTDKQVSILPSFMLSENSQMFEMATLPYYIKFFKSPKKGKSFFAEYLKEKSIYHENRANYLRSILPSWENPNEKDIILKGLNYEEAQSVVFRNLDEDILKIEAKKVEFLSNFREAFGNLDGKNHSGNFVATTSSYLMTLSSIQALRREIATQKANKYLSNARKDYLNLTNDYVNFWFENIKNWIREILSENIKQAERIEFAQNSKTRFNRLVNMTDFCGKIDRKFRPIYTDEFKLNENTNGNKILNDIKELFTRTLKDKLSRIGDKKLNNKYEEMRSINEKLLKAFNENRGLDVINLSLLSIVKNREFKNLLKSRCPLYLKGEMFNDTHILKEWYKELIGQNFNYIFDTILSNSPENGSLTGYNKMWEFSLYK